MKKFIIFLIVILSYAFSMKATYIAKYGWFGKIGIATGYFDKNSTNYIIKTNAKLTGIAALLSHHLQTSYISIGKVKNNILYPKEYIYIRKNSKKEVKTIFIFHKKYIQKIRYINKKLNSKSKLSYYTNQDVLSLYFNLPKFIKNYNKSYIFYAIGGRHNDGKIEITFPKGNQLKKIKKVFNYTKGIYIKANLYNKIFAGDKGILYLVIDPSNWVTLKGMVKHVLKIGNLKGKLVKLQVNP